MRSNAPVYSDTFGASGDNNNTADTKTVTNKSVKIYTPIKVNARFILYRIARMPDKYNCFLLFFYQQVFHNELFV